MVADMEHVYHVGSSKMKRIKVIVTSIVSVTFDFENTFLYLAENI